MKQSIDGSLKNRYEKNRGLLRRYDYAWTFQVEPKSLPCIGANVCPSGTWLDASMGLSKGKLPIPSNVTRISEAIKPMSSSGIYQVVFYQAGIGSTGNILNRVIGG